MSTESSFSNQFLIGLPNLKGDFFQGALSLLIEHNENGAFGLVVNKPLEIRLNDLFPEFAIDHPECPVLEGGPVHRDKAFFLHNGDHNYKATFTLSKGILLTTSVDVLEDLSTGGGPTKMLTLLGYAGWDPGQLEDELTEHVWLLAPSSSEILFDTPCEQKATAAAEALGVDINLMAPSPGHG